MSSADPETQVLLQTFTRRQEKDTKNREEGEREEERSGKQLEHLLGKLLHCEPVS